MTLEEFRALIDTHGARQDDWPPGRREDALALLRQSQEARTELAAMAELEDQLRGSERTKAPDGLVDRIVKAAQAQTPEDET